MKLKKENRYGRDWESLEQISTDHATKNIQMTSKNQMSTNMVAHQMNITVLCASYNQIDVIIHWIKWHPDYKTSISHWINNHKGWRKVNEMKTKLFIVSIGKIQISEDFK